MEPSEYVQSASFHARISGDSRNSEERFEETDNACFTAMEIAKVGNADATLLSDNERAISLIRDAVEESSGGDFIIPAALCRQRWRR